MKQILKVVRYGILLLLLALLTGMIYLVVISRGTTSPIVDEQGTPIPNSIASLEEIELNGTRQWILIRGYDRTKPVLLFIHGGPGLPQMPSLTNNPEMEKRFVVVHWDQRGSGKSYDPDVFNALFTLDTFVEDAAELSRKLIRRFPRRGEQHTKIYIMGHSWGTFLGIRTVQKYPGLFYAYLGIGQMADQAAAEQLSYDWTLRQAWQHHNTDHVEFLTQTGRPPFATGREWTDYFLRQRRMVAAYGGAMHRGSFTKTYFTSVLLCREYTVQDKLHYLPGALETTRRLWPVVVATNLSQTAPELRVPVYIFQGVHDYQTPYVIARAYFDQLKAPEKRFFTFQHSAHGPIYEEPELFWSYVDAALGQQAD